VQHQVILRTQSMSDIGRALGKDLDEARDPGLGEP
jgi:hypothetical protein